MTLRGDVLRNIVALVLALAIAVPFSMASVTAFADTTESSSEESSTDETTDDVEDDTSSEESTESSTAAESSTSSETSTASAASTISVPSASSDYYVYDENNVISEETRQSIVQTGEYLNTQYGAQIVVAVFNTLGDANIETYTNQILTSWKVGGDAGYGLLFLMDISEDDYYCISGDGLKQLYTSSKIQTVLDDSIESLFAAKDYDAAALAFVNACSNDLEKYMQDLVASGVVLTTNNAAGDTTSTTDSSTAETTASTDSKSSSGFLGFLKGLLIFILVLVIILCAGFVVIYLHGQKIKRERAERRRARNRSAQGSSQRTSQRDPQSRERSHSSSRPSNSQHRPSSQSRQQAQTRETTVVNKSGSAEDSYRDFMNKY